MSFAAKTPLDEFVVGLHCVFERNGITFNDLTQTERYALEDITDSPDRKIAAEDNPQDHGEVPLPAYYGGRTMTMSGFIEAGSYPTLLRMEAALKDSLMDLVEMPMTIRVQDDPTSWFRQPDVIFTCRPFDVPQISRKTQSSDRTGMFKRSFTIAFRGSDMRYLGTVLKGVSIAPTVITLLGRSYPRSYPLSYTHTMDPTGTPADDLNSAIAQNDGNWIATPLIRFSGYMLNPRLKNLTNDETISLVGPIVAGDYIDVNVSTGQITDSAGINRAGQWDPRSDWLTLIAKRGASDGASDLSLQVSDFTAGAGVNVLWVDTNL